MPHDRVVDSEGQRGGSVAPVGAWNEECAVGNVAPAEQAQDQDQDHSARPSSVVICSCPLAAALDHLYMFCFHVLNTFYFKYILF